MAIIMKAKPVVDAMFKNWEKKVDKVAIFSNSEDFASGVYVGNKVKAFNKRGIEVDVIDTADKNISDIHAKQVNYEVFGTPYMFQLPQKRDLNLTVLLEHMSPALDMDCMSPNQVGMFYEHPSIYNSPCTPFGITLLLKHYIPREKLQGSNVVVIGRSAIVGRPIARLMEFEFNSTVTICHSKTKDLKFYTQNADIIIVAVGKEKLLTAELIKDGAIIVDVGINRNAEGKVCGDADYDNLLDKVYAITPVPGGVGPMTVASLVYKNGEVK